MDFKDIFNPLFSCAARVCERSYTARNLLRNFAFRGKGRIVARLRPEAFGAEIVAGCRGGIRYQLDLADHLQRELYFNCNPAEELELRRVVDLIPVGGTCLDVGANMGTFAFRFARRVGGRGRVHAFEPDPANVVRLVANAALNGLEGVMVCHQAAVTNVSGDVLFYRSDSAHSGHGSLVEFKDIACEQCRVSAITLDGFLRAERIEAVDLLKVDIEANEPELLEGAWQSLAAQVFRYILIECNGVRLAERGKVLADLLNPILGAGYLPQSAEDVRRLRTAETRFETVCMNLMFAAGMPPQQCDSTVRSREIDD